MNVTRWVERRIIRSVTRNEYARNFFRASAVFTFVRVEQPLQVDLRVSDIFDDFFSHQFWVCGKKGPMKSLCSRTPRNLQTVLLQTPIFYELFILMICFDAEWIAHKKNSNLWVTYDQRITFNYIDTCREGIFSFS